MSPGPAESLGPVSGPQSPYCQIGTVPVLEDAVRNLWQVLTAEQGTRDTLRKS